jgi:hypothetical protein
MLTDTLQFAPYIPFLGYILLPIVRFVFKHRHRHLRQWSALKSKPTQGEAENEHLSP